MKINSSTLAYFTTLLLTALSEHFSIANPDDRDDAIYHHHHQQQQHKKSLRSGGRAKSLYDCSNGCPFETDTVCAGGLTYQNACLAYCQGEKEIESGLCNDDEQNAMLQFSNNKTETVDLQRTARTSFDMNMMSPALMQRFTGEGFKYIGSIEMDDAETFATYISNFDKNANVDEDHVLSNEEEEEEDLQALKSGNTNDSLSTAFRITSEGDMYIAPSFRAPTGTGSDEDKHRRMVSEEQKPDQQIPLTRSEAEGSIRTLSVLGRDTRMRVPSSERNWPYYRVGKISGCSASIVGRNKVLTNAHCVFNIEKQRWRTPSTFTPGQNPTAPWGSWNVDYATVLKTYTTRTRYDSVAMEHDYAILTMKNDNWTGQHVGTYMGYFPLHSASCSQVDGRRAKKRIVGYPGDKPFGTMWNSGVCDDWNYSCGSKVVRHQCDTSPGSSGSPMLLFFNSGSPRVIGVHAFAGRSSNGGPVFTRSDVISAIRSW